MSWIRMSCLPGWNLLAPPMQQQQLQLVPSFQQNHTDVVASVSHVCSYLLPPVALLRKSAGTATRITHCPRSNNVFESVPVTKPKRSSGRLCIHSWHLTLAFIGIHLFDGLFWFLFFPQRRKDIGTKIGDPNGSSRSRHANRRYTEQQCFDPFDRVLLGGDASPVADGSPTSSLRPGSDPSLPARSSEFCMVKAILAL